MIDKLCAYSLDIVSSDYLDKDNLSFHMILEDFQNVSQLFLVD